MKRALPAVAAALGVLLLLLAFWALAPSVEPVPAPRAGEGDDGVRPLAVDRARPTRDGEEGPGPPAGVDEEDEGPDVLAEVRSPAEFGVRGGLGRMRRVVERMEAIEGEPIPAGLSAAEEDALIARPIADKAKLLNELELDARMIRGGEDPVMMARADLLLARAHSHMADFLEDRPVPSYLSDEASDAWLLQLENNADVQRDKAAEAKQRARDSAADAELPEDHPLHDRLQ